MTKVHARAQLNDLRISPRKVRLVANLIRGKSIMEATNELLANKKHAARPILKLINSAVANATHNHMAENDTLIVETIFVNEGATMKRWMPRAMGRATPIKKRTSHVTVIVSGETKEAKIETAPKEKTETKKPKKEEKTEKPKSKSKTKKTTAKKTTSKKSTKKTKA